MKNTIYHILKVALILLVFYGFAIPSGYSQSGKIRSYPWEKFVRNPTTLPVTVLVTNILSEVSSSVVVTLGGRGVEHFGEGHGQYTSAQPFTADLNVRREYVLTVTAADLTSLEIHLLPRPSAAPVGTSGRTAIPKKYFIWKDRGLSEDGVILVNNNTGQPSYSQTWTIELNEQVPARWRLEDGSDNSAAAFGDGGWAELGPGKDLNPGKAEINWSVSLGRLMDGQAAGRLNLKEKGITRATYSATNLYYSASSVILRDEVELITETSSNPILRQVNAYQTFVDIVAVSTNRTELRFYLPAQKGTQTNSHGHYTSITGSPYVVWAILNPEPSTTNKLNIVEQRNGLSRTNQFVYTPGNTNETWVLKYGSGSEERVETRGVAVTVNAGVTNRTETVDIRYFNALSPAYRATETYRYYPWGFELVETRIDPDGNSGTSNDLVTTYSYYDNESDEATYKRLSSRVHPDGYWEKNIYGYGVYPLAIFRPFGDSPATPPANPSQADCTATLYDLQQFASTFRSFLPTSDPESWETLFQEEHHLANDAGIFSEARELRGSYLSLSDGRVGFHSHGLGELSAFGYYGHPLAHNPTQGPSEISYYNAVDYDPQTLSYSVDSSGDAWDGPDWRKCTIYTLEDYGPSLGFSDEDAEIVQILWADGQMLYDPIDFAFDEPPFVINQSYRDSFIYHGGNLRFSERHILTGTTSTNVAVFDLVYSTAYETDSLGHVTNIIRIDGATSVSRVIYSADYRGTNSVDGDLLLWEMDETGLKRSYTYDFLKRVSSIKRAGIGSQADLITYFGYDAYGRTTSTTNSAAGLSYESKTAFDLAGRTISHTATNGLVTATAYDLGGLKVTTTFPNGTTEIKENYRDRRLKSITGTGVVHEFHSWEPHYKDLNTSERPVNWRLGAKEIVRYGSTNSERKIINWYDLVGRVVLSQRPEWDSTNFVSELTFYNGEDKQGTARTTGRDESGELLHVELANYDLVSREQNAIANFIDYSSYWIWGRGPAFAVDNEWSDWRLRRMAPRFAKIGGAWFACRTNLTYLVEFDGTPTIESVLHERLNGFTSGNTLSEIKTWDADTNLISTTVTVDKAQKKVTEITSLPTSTLTPTRVLINGLVRTESSATISQPTGYWYDALERLISVTNTSGAVSVFAYNQFGQVTNHLDFSGVVTEFEYYPSGVAGAGEIKRATTTGSWKNEYYSYSPFGLWRAWGDVPYPEERIYSVYGELTELRTFQGGSHWNLASWPTNSGATNRTIWVYDLPTGLLDYKIDDSNAATYFTYEFGRQIGRTSAVSTVTTYAYNLFGEPTSISYSDSTPDVSFVSETFPSYSRRGLPLMIEDGSGTWELYYDHAGRETARVCSAGLLDGVTISNRFNGLNGRDRLAVLHDTTSLFAHDYSYRSDGRLESVGSSLQTATYSYYPNTDFLATTTFKSNGVTNLLTTRSWERGVRLKAISNTTTLETISAHAYNYDAFNRRRQATLDDGSAWVYDYNERDELVRGSRFWGDQEPVAGQQFEFSYDNIGNRTSAKSGGDASGLNLRETSYTANSLNQYSTVITPGFEDICGVARATNGVLVNGNSADRKIEYFHKEVEIGNITEPIWQGVTVTVGGVSSNGGFVFPKYEEDFTYDANGNLVSDGVWTYGWDGENRLTSMEMADITANTNRLKLSFEYDGIGRRFSKAVSVWDGAAFAEQSKTYFIYDEWLLVGSLNTNKAPLQSYAWVVDLSGTITDAGGVGGLVWIKDHASGDYHFPAYDGNGNVTGLVQSSGTPSAKYEYSPFGEVTRSTGHASRLNPFQFSTKYLDQETGLSYYGHRYYSASLGRWISRDPIEEEDGPNVYAFVRNRPISLFDGLGLMSSPEQGTVGGVSGGLSSSGSQAITYLRQVREMVDKFNDIQEIASIAMDMFQASDEVFEMLMQAGRSTLADGPSGRMGRKNHSIPKFMTGEAGQNLIELGGGRHESFHDVLGRHMQAAGYPHGKGGSFDYQGFKALIGKDRATRREAFRALLRASFEFDDKHDGKGSFVVHMLGNFLGGRSQFR